MYRERLAKGYLGQREGGTEEVREKGRMVGQRNRRTKRGRQGSVNNRRRERGRNR